MYPHAPPNLSDGVATVDDVEVDVLHFWTSTGVLQPLHPEFLYVQTGVLLLLSLHICILFPSVTDCLGPRRTRRIPGIVSGMLDLLSIGARADCWAFAPQISSPTYSIDSDFQFPALEDLEKLASLREKLAMIYQKVSLLSTFVFMANIGCRSVTIAWRRLSECLKPSVMASAIYSSDSGSRAKNRKLLPGDTAKRAIAAKGWSWLEGVNEVSASNIHIPWH